MNQAPSQNQSSRNAQNLFTQKTPEPKKSRFFKITVTIAVIVVLILLYKTFASTGVGTAGNISLNYDTNTIKQQEGKIECIEDDRILQWHEGLEMWECRKPTSAVFGELDKNNVKVNDSGELECREDGKVLFWDKDQWACGDAGSTNFLTTENGITLDNSVLSIDAPTCDSDEKLQWSGEEFICSEDISNDAQTLTLNNNELFISDGNSVDLSSLQSEDVWELNGNSGTDDNSDFIGTTDNENLVFKTDDSERMRIDKDGQIQFKNYSFPVADGTLNQILQTDGSGTLSWADSSSSSLWDTDLDTGIQVEESADEDVIRFDAGGSEVLSVDGDGRLSGSQIDTNKNNIGSVYMGVDAGVDDNNVYNINVGIGKGALNANANGAESVAVGAFALNKNTIGGYNSAVGAYAMSSNTEGFENVALGYGALDSNTLGDGNSSIGVTSLDSNTLGNNNSAFGYYSLAGNTTGSKNTANGYRSGYLIANGSTRNQTSSNSVYLGAETKALADGANNEIVIGYNTIGNGSNTVTLENDDIVDTYLKGNSHTTGSMQVADDADTCDTTKVGTLKYYSDTNDSYVDMCVQDGASSYTWRTINQETW